MTWATIADVRAEGFAADVFTDARVQTSLDRAHAMVESATLRFFEARRQVIRLDGTGRAFLDVVDPVIQIEELAVEDPIGGGFTIVPLEGVRLYNRHLADRLLSPDDRENPRLEFTFAVRPIFGAGSFPAGNQNIRVTGTFGYTDPLTTFTPASGETLTFADDNPDTITRSVGDWTTEGFLVGQVVHVRGSTLNDGTFTIDALTATVMTLVAGDALVAEGPTAGEAFRIYTSGIAPPLVVWATTVTAARYLERHADIAKREDQTQRWRVSGQGGSGRSLSLVGQARGFATGDPDIDTVLARYRRPSHVGVTGPGRRPPTRLTSI